MTLNDEDILTAVTKAGLIDPCEAGNVQNCRYYLRAGRVFMPETGDELLLSPVATQTPNGAAATQALSWRIEPSDTLVMMTEEVLNLPSHLLATYGPLNHLAQKGLLLVNASIIEPGYNGPLSCYFVNFSSKAIRIFPGDPIAKICFHTLSRPPKNPAPLIISRDRYAKNLSEAAQSYPRSFLGVGKLEERVAEAATKSVRTSLIWGGVIIGFLLFFSTLEPFINKFVWDRAGVVSTSSRSEIEAIKSQMEKQQQKLDDERQRMELIDKQRQEHYDKMVLQFQDAKKQDAKKANKP